MSKKYTIHSELLFSLQLLAFTYTLFGSDDNMFEYKNKAKTAKIMYR